MKLSILVPSVHTRRNTFLPKIQDEIYRQIDNLNSVQKTEVEVIVLSDNKTIMLGDKRNLLVEIAQGKYIQFVDDDDRISSDFISTLLEATETDADVISFNAEVSINGQKPKICDYSIKHLKDYNTRNGYFRIPNHISCVKREVSLLSSFPSLKYAEDQAYAKLLLPHLKTEHKINKVLYYYDYNDNVTETQFQNMPENIRKRREQPPIVDVIILSRANNPRLKAMTQKTIDTAIAGANQLSVNVIVIEQTPHVQYNNAQTIYHDAEFNYNSFMNLGARNCNSEWIIFANNDLIFHNGYLHELLTANNKLVSPHEPRDPRQSDIKENTIGTVNGKHFSGWCFMIKRDLWDNIGGLDEDFGFWFADDSVIQQCVNKGVKPMIVKKSLVTHLGSTTFKTLDSKKKDDYTWGLTEKFNNKYNQNKFADNQYYKEWKLKKSQ